MTSTLQAPRFPDASFSGDRFDLDDYIDYVIAICKTLSKEHDELSLRTLAVDPPNCRRCFDGGAGQPARARFKTLMVGPIARSGR